MKKLLSLLALGSLLTTLADAPTACIKKQPLPADNDADKVKNATANTVLELPGIAFQDGVNTSNASVKEGLTYVLYKNNPSLENQVINTQSTLSFERGINVDQASGAETNVTLTITSAKDGSTAEVVTFAAIPSTPAVDQQLIGEIANKIDSSKVLILNQELPTPNLSNPAARTAILSRLRDENPNINSFEARALSITASGPIVFDGTEFDLNIISGASTDTVSLTVSYDIIQIIKQKITNFAITINEIGNTPNWNTTTKNNIKIALQNDNTSLTNTDLTHIVINNGTNLSLGIVTDVSWSITDQQRVVQQTTPLAVTVGVIKSSQHLIANSKLINLSTSLKTWFNGTLWVASAREGLYELTGNTLKQYINGSLLDNSTVTNMTVSNVASNEVLWISFLNNITYYTAAITASGNTYTLTPVLLGPNSKFTSLIDFIYIDPNSNTIFISNHANGIYRFSNADYSTAGQQISAPAGWVAGTFVTKINGLRDDGKNYLIVGTDKSGLFYLNESNSIVKQITIASTSSRDVTQLFVDGSNVYSGFNDNSLFRISNFNSSTAVTTQEITYDKGSNVVIDVIDADYSTLNKHIWIGTAVGLYVLSIDSNVAVKLNSSPFQRGDQILSNRSDSKWIFAINSGTLTVYDANFPIARPVIDDLSTRNVNSLIFTNLNNIDNPILIATTTGLKRISSRWNVEVNVQGWPNNQPANRLFFYEGNSQVFVDSSDGIHQVQF